MNETGSIQIKLFGRPEEFDPGPPEISSPNCFLILGAQGVVGFCQPRVDAFGLTNHVEVHWSRDDGVPVAGLLGELTNVSVRIAWVREGTLSSRGSRNCQAVLRFASSTNCETANLLVRSMARKR